MKKLADAILTGDWHLREDQPICRTDDFTKTQWVKVQFIRDLQQKHGCPVLHSGDLFDHWKPSPFLISQTLKHLPAQFHTIYGNHDLPQHNLELSDKTGINVLKEANRLKVIAGTHWGKTPEKHSLIIQGKTITIWHVMTWVGESPWPNCTDPKASDIFKTIDSDLILTGHNHKPFTINSGTRLLVNPGSITRQSADEEERQPRVLLWFADTNTVEVVYLPIENNVISREHLERKEERDLRLEAFISRLNNRWKAGVNFEDNLEAFFKKNQIRDSIKQIIYKAIEN